MRQVRARRVARRRVEAGRPASRESCVEQDRQVAAGLGFTGVSAAGVSAAACGEEHADTGDERNCAHVSFAAL
ncbi:MAG: hypothetical protein ACTH31_00510 [Pseudoclavibacter sp.]